MGGGKPTMPENTMNTLTANDCHSAHTSSFTKTGHPLCAVATAELRTCLTHKLHLHRRPLAWFAQGLLLSRNDGDSLQHHHEVFSTYYTHTRVLSEPSSHNSMIGSHHQLCACCRAQIRIRALPRSVPPIRAIADPG